LRWCVNSCCFWWSLHPHTKVVLVRLLLRQFYRVVSCLLEQAIPSWSSFRWTIWWSIGWVRKKYRCLIAYCVRRKNNSLQIFISLCCWKREIFKSIIENKIVERWSYAVVVFQYNLQLFFWIFVAYRVDEQLIDFAFDIVVAVVILKF